MTDAYSESLRPSGTVPDCCHAGAAVLGAFFDLVPDCGRSRLLQTSQSLRCADSATAYGYIADEDAPDIATGLTGPCPRPAAAAQPIPPRPASSTSGAFVDLTDSPERAPPARKVVLCLVRYCPLALCGPPHMICNGRRWHAEDAAG
jgi:hypothetical protein